MASHHGGQPVNTINLTGPDAWFVDESAERAEIRDENRLLVATAHDFDEARGIVREHNAHAQLLAALREMREHAQQGVVEADRHHVQAWRWQLAKIDAAIAKAGES
jgi:hypothetical protein